MKSEKAKLYAVTFLGIAFLVLFAGAEFFVQQCGGSLGNSVTDSLCSAKTNLLARAIQGVSLLGAVLCAVFMSGAVADAIVDQKTKTVPTVLLSIYAFLAGLCLSGAVGVVLEKAAVHYL